MENEQLKTATAATGPKRKWTVMVFMGADNLPGEADLSADAERDIAELKKVPSTDNLNIFVQLHGKGFVRREHIGKPPTNLSQEEADATNGKGLIAFMRWAIETARHKEEDYSLLVLWGHAYRFAIGYTRVGTRIDALDFAELQMVLTRFQEEYRVQQGSQSRPRLDIVGFDACDLATVEMAYQLHPFAKYLVASQIGIPLPGWPYERILDRLKISKGRTMGPPELGAYIVRRYCESYPETVRVSLTLLDLSRGGELFDLTENLARSIAIAIGDDPQAQDLVSELFMRSRVIDNDPKPFVDVADLCLNLELYCADDNVRNAARAFGNFVFSPGPVLRHASETGAGKPFVVEHGRNAGRTARLHGVSLYAPHVAGDAHDWPAASQQYEKFVVVQKTLWYELVRALAV